MAIDLTKMVEFLDRVSMEEGSAHHQLLLAMAADIKANREEIEKLKQRQRSIENPKTDEEKGVPQ